MLSMQERIPATAQKIGAAYVDLGPAYRAGFCTVRVWKSARAKVPNYYAAADIDAACAIIASVVEHAEAHAAKIAARRQERKAADKARLDEMKAACVKGAIFYTSWGYDQTNIEFFEVVERVSDSYILIREIAGDWKSTAWCQADGKPLPGEYVGESMRRRIQPYGIRVSTSRTAWPCEAGRTYHATSYA